MKKLMALLLLLGACSRGGEEAGNGVAPSGESGARTGSDGPRGSSGKGGGAAASTRLNGQWEGGSGARKSQICMIEKGDTAQFGLLVWGAGDMSCSGAGEASRRGSALTLEMAGDRTCRIEATIEGGRITLPATLPEGCSYYCGPGVRMAGERFDKAGSERADALKAKDIAGDPLCG